MKTRKQYLNDECTHDEYYSQFVTDTIKERVLNRFSIAELQVAYKEDHHFNTLTLTAFDNLASAMNLKAHVYRKLILAEDTYTFSGAVCILKQAAKMIVLNK